MAILECVVESVDGVGLLLDHDGREADALRTNPGIKTTKALLESEEFHTDLLELAEHAVRDSKAIKPITANL